MAVEAGAAAASRRTGRRSWEAQRQESVTHRTLCYPCRVITGDKGDSDDYIPFLRLLNHLRRLRLWAMLPGWRSSGLTFGVGVLALPYLWVQTNYRYNTDKCYSREVSLVGPECAMSTSH